MMTLVTSAEMRRMKDLSFIPGFSFLCLQTCPNDLAAIQSVLRTQPKECLRRQLQLGSCLPERETRARNFQNVLSLNTVYKGAKWMCGTDTSCTALELEPLP